MRIMDDTERARQLKQAKESLQAQRRQANLDASMQRYAIMQVGSPLGFLPRERGARGRAGRERHRWSC